MRVYEGRKYYVIWKSEITNKLVLFCRECGGSVEEEIAPIPQKEYNKNIHRINKIIQQMIRRHEKKVREYGFHGAPLKL